MTKKELIGNIAARTHLSLVMADAMVNAMVCEIEQALCTEGEFILHGVGTLRVRTRNARTGRNPRTGEPLQIAARKTITFSTAKKMSNGLNQDDVGIAWCSGENGIWPITNNT